MTRPIQSASFQDATYQAATVTVSQNDASPSIRNIDEIYQLGIQKLERRDYWFGKKQGKVAEVILATSMPHFSPKIPHNLVHSVHRKLSLILAVLHEENMAARIRPEEQSLVLTGAEVHIFQTILKRLVRNSILLQKQNDSRDLFLLLKRPMVEVLDDVDFLRH